MTASGAKKGNVKKKNTPGQSDNSVSDTSVSADGSPALLIRVVPAAKATAFRPEALNDLARRSGADSRVIWCQVFLFFRSQSCRSSASLLVSHP